MDTLTRHQAREFRIHHERVWPLDFCLRCVLPPALAFWLSFGVASLTSNSPAASTGDSGEAPSVGIVIGVLQKTEEFLWARPMISGIIFTVAAVSWLGAVAGPWLPGRFRSRISRAPVFPALDAMLAAFSGLLVVGIGVTLAAERVLSRGWSLWVVGLVFGLWAWWLFFAFRPSSGPSNTRLLFWRLGVIATFSSGIALAIQRTPVERQNESAVVDLRSHSKEILDAFRDLQIPSSIQGAPLPGKAERQRNEVIVKFFQPKPAPAPTDAGASPQLGPGGRDVPKMSPSLSQADILRMLLEILGYGFLFPHGSGSGGGDSPHDESGAALNVNQVVTQLKSAPKDKRDFALHALKEIAKANPKQIQFSRSLNEVIEKLEQGHTSLPPAPPVGSRSPEETQK
jgi:hypothetical protein